MSLMLVTRPYFKGPRALFYGVSYRDQGDVGERKAFLLLMSMGSREITSSSGNRNASIYQDLGERENLQGIPKNSTFPTRERQICSIHRPRGGATRQVRTLSSLLSSPTSGASKEDSS